MGDTIITTQLQFAAGTFTPADGADTDTHPGSLEVAAGKTQLVASYVGEQDNYTAGEWGDLTVIGYAPGASTIRARIRLAASEEGLAAATFSHYTSGWVPALDPETGLPREDGMGTCVIDVGALILNEELTEAGPWYEIQLLLKTD